MSYSIMYTCHRFNGQLDDMFGTTPFRSEPMYIAAHTQEAIVKFLKEDGYKEIRREYYNNGDGLKIEVEHNYFDGEVSKKIVFAIVPVYVIDEIVETL